MTLLDHPAQTARRSPSETQTTPEGSTTLIILERDGSLRHYPPDPPDDPHRRAQVSLEEAQAEPTMIDRILDFTFDVLGINTLEVKVYEQR
jgi:hypothetical protein